MKRWTLWSAQAIALAALLIAAGRTPPASAAPGDPLADYGVDLVTDYVSRGQDLLVSKFDKSGKEHSAFNVAPTLQPYLTLHGAAGMSFGVWGSFALTDRKADGAFAGLKKADEIDYTLAWDWSNALGGFSAGLASYTYVFAPASNELFLKWSPTFMASLSPSIATYVVPDPGATSGRYTSFGISGGEKLSWHASLGIGDKLQDLTAGVGYGFGSMSASFNVAYRPNVGTYTFGTETKDGPPAIVWLTLSYSGSVAE